MYVRPRLGSGSSNGLGACATCEERYAAVAGLGRVGQPDSISCAQPGEIAASNTNAGVLTKDVEETRNGILVADFGVHSRSVKPGAKAELAPTLELLENNIVKEIRIIGFDDSMKATPQMHRYLRKHRALRVLALLGPKARTKVKFADAAPLDTFFGPNTDRDARARNRSVLIEFVLTGRNCTHELMQLALDHIKGDPTMNAKVKSRVGAAIGNSLAGRNDSFIRPDSAGDPFPFRWSGIKEYFEQICAQPGGAASLRDKLVKLDQDIKMGLRLLTWEERRGKPRPQVGPRFRRRLDALLKNKSQTAYAGYVTK